MVTSYPIIKNFKLKINIVPLLSEAEFDADITKKLILACKAKHFNTDNFNVHTAKEQ